MNEPDWVAAFLDPATDTEETFNWWAVPYNLYPLVSDESRSWEGLAVRMSEESLWELSEESSIQGFVAKARAHWQGAAQTTYSGFLWDAETFLWNTSCNSLC